jgi:haloacetate dehalogenase
MSMSEALHQQLFPGFEQRSVATDEDVQISFAVGGSGPPLLLLHGHQQTHTI